MEEYKNFSEEYFNNEKRVYDEDGNLIAVEYENEDGTIYEFPFNL